MNILPLLIFFSLIRAGVSLSLTTLGIMKFDLFLYDLGASVGVFLVWITVLVIDRIKRK